MLDYCRAVPPRPCLGSIAIHDIRCTAVTPFIKDCLTEAILIPFVHHAADVPLDTKRMITLYPPHAGDIVLDIAKG
jgi:hypothetical protein